MKLAQITNQTMTSYATDYNDYSAISPSSNDDQSVKSDNGKSKLTLVPLQILYDIAKVREYAVNNKYKDPDNWKQVSIERFRDAAFRHLCAYIRQPKGKDEESGMPHLWHLATNIAFLCELESEKDDRY